jgi:peptide/nickel transport system permease protein
VVSFIIRRLLWMVVLLLVISFGGAILTETAFNIPGVGHLAYGVIQKSDLPTVQGTVLIGAFSIIALNLLVDIGYAYLDPRVRRV